MANNVKIGSIVHLDSASDIESKFQKLAELGLDSCQLASWDIALRTDEMADKINELKEKYNIEISCLWCGWSPTCFWNFYEGQETLGLIPTAYRQHRLQELIQGSHWAKKIGAPDLTTHVGYMPENPYDPNYAGVLAALKILLLTVKENGQYFNFETGQETPVTLRRAIADLGDDNLGINLDPANLILYGKANPCDAMDVFGDFVRGLHCKDGLYPTDGKNLGKEVPLGEGKVNFPKLVELLHAHKYKGHFTIEREISGEQQIADIIKAKDLINELTSQYDWNFEE